MGEHPNLAEQVRRLSGNTTATGLMLKEIASAAPEGRKRAAELWPTLGLTTSDAAGFMEALQTHLRQLQDDRLDLLVEHALLCHVLAGANEWFKGCALRHELFRSLAPFYGVIAALAPTWEVDSGQGVTIRRLGGALGKWYGWISFALRANSRLLTIALRHEPDGRAVIVDAVQLATEASGNFPYGIFKSNGFVIRDPRSAPTVQKQL